MLKAQMLQINLAADTADKCGMLPRVSWQIPQSTGAVSSSDVDCASACRPAARLSLPPTHCMTTATQRQTGLVSNLSVHNFSNSPSLIPPKCVAKHQLLCTHKCVNPSRTHIHTHFILTAIFPGEPGLPSCLINSPFSIYF